MNEDGRPSATEAAVKRDGQRRLGPGHRRLLWASVSFFAAVCLVVVLMALGVEHH